MKKRDFYYTSKDKITKIHAIEWIPEGEPKGILQICHGMCEYIERYNEYASYMAEKGFYVVGNDHLGHGESVHDEESHGFFNEKLGNLYLMGDIHTLRKKVSSKFPGLPYFILGHSMGSFLTRQYISLEGDGLSGAIIMGTGNQANSVVNFGMKLCKRGAERVGWTYRSKFINAIAFGGYNKKIKKPDSYTDWLSNDKEIVEKYNTDPWCTFVFTLNAFYNMFLSIGDAQNPDTIKHIPKTLPIHIVSGDQDPVGNYGKSVKEVYEAYVNAGIEDVSIKLYPEYRHEILNEINRQEVFDDLYNWILSKM